MERDAPCDYFAGGGDGCSPYCLHFGKEPEGCLQCIKYVAGDPREQFRCARWNDWITVEDRGDLK